MATLTPAYNRDYKKKKKMKLSMKIEILFITLMKVKNITQNKS